MNHSDWLLIVADLAQPRPLTPVQLQKCLFLLDKKLSPAQKGAESIYQFTPYDYGPFDATVYQDAEGFASQGLMSIQKAPGQSFKTYSVTPAGHAQAQQVMEGLAPQIKEYARALVDWVQGLSFNQLVSAVYKEYPEMKANSVFRG
jgi:uncharacterized protein